MFNFNIHRNESQSRKDQYRSSYFRLTGFKHNPYVGSFHGVKVPQVKDDIIPIDSVVMSEAKNNPIVGVFRHSPANISQTLGLKCIIYDSSECNKGLVLSQVQVSRQNKKLSSLSSFVSSMKQLPVRRYSNSISSESNHSKARSSIRNDLEVGPPVCDFDAPLCSICIESYSDGDKLITLKCSHCFHYQCLTQWFYQACLVNEESASMSCPECRQDHGDFCGEEVGISNQSFLRMGQGIHNDRGYDFLSDMGTEHHRSPCPRSPAIESNSDKMKTSIQDTVPTALQLSSQMDDLKLIESKDDEAEAQIHIQTDIGLDANEIYFEGIAIPSPKLVGQVKILFDPTDSNSSIGVNAVHSDGISASGSDESNSKQDFNSLMGSTYSDCGYPVMDDRAVNRIR